MNMLALRKPKKLNRGDTVAAVSLSWGGAGDLGLLWRYEEGKRRLQEDFGLKVIEMPHTLKGSDYVYRHPEERAEDLMAAFNNPEIKGVFSCIGGDDSIRLLPYLDFERIGRNPKIFLGYSDSTVTHFICMKAGFSSFYGPSVLAEFAENVKIFDYTSHWINKVLYDASPIGAVPPADAWTGERLEWTLANKLIEKQLAPNRGYEILQGRGRVKGPLIGGCIEVMEMMKGTALWPSHETFEGALLFLETSEETPEPTSLKYWLRNYGAMGVLHAVNGILWAKPYQEKHDEAYKKVLLDVVGQEFGLKDLPVMCNMSFGHNEPMCCLPYGAAAEMDCDAKTFTITDPGVAE